MQRSLDKTRVEAEVGETPQPTKLDEILLVLENQPKFYKAVAGNDPNITLITPKLTEEERVELLGPKYLNFQKDELSRWNYRSALIGFRGKDRQLPNGKMQLELWWNPQSPNSEADDDTPSIARLNEDIRLRTESIKRNAIIAKEASIEARRVFNEIYQKPLIPAIEALIKLRIHLTLRDGGGIVDEQTTDDIFAEANHYAELEEAESHLPYIGLEVELPYMGHTRTEDPHATFVAFMEFLPMLENLGIPTELDKQGEVALPKSKNPFLQLRLLELIHKEGYLPVDPSGQTTPKYTLHVNVGTPGESPLRNSLNDYWKNKQPGEDIIQLWTLGAVCGILYSNRLRINNGAYCEPASYKGEHKPDYRLELRTLGYNPNATISENAVMLEDIRLIALPATHAFSADEQIPEIAETFHHWIGGCTTLIAKHEPRFKDVGDQQPDDYYFREVMLNALENPVLIDDLRSLTTRYMDNTRTLVEKHKEELIKLG